MKPMPVERPRAAAAVEEPAPRQGGLFSPGQMAGARSRVVPISAGTGVDAEPRIVSRKSSPRPKAIGRKPESDVQQTLAFGAANSHRRARTDLNSDIYCDAPVARLSHRGLAWFVDLSLVAAGWGCFTGIFLAAGGQIGSDLFSLISLGAMAVFVALLYHLFWALADGDSAGYRWAHLRLIDFDGARPNRQRRLTRLAASWLSILPGGLGLIWALMDEETLTWQDHISKTFPTPVAVAGPLRTEHVSTGH